METEDDAGRMAAFVCHDVVKRPQGKSGVLVNLQKGLDPSKS